MSGNNYLKCFKRLSGNDVTAKTIFQIRAAAAADNGEVRDGHREGAECSPNEHVSGTNIYMGAINQSISMNLLWRPTSKALGRQKYNENTTASQCHNNDSAKR